MSNDGRSRAVSHGDESFNVIVGPACTARDDRITVHAWTKVDFPGVFLRVPAVRAFRQKVVVHQLLLCVSPGER